MDELPQEEIWKSYELLPEQLKEAIFSVQTADNIATACQVAGVTDSRESLVGKLTGRVLLGLISPEQFENELVTQAELSAQQAAQVAHQLQRLVFAPVKEQLAALYESLLNTPTAAPDAPEQSSARRNTDDPYREDVG